MTSEASGTAVAERQAEEPADDDKSQAIQHLRDLVSGEKKLRVKTDDIYMLRFLRSSDFDPEKAFAKMKAVYQLKAANRDWYPCQPVKQYDWLLSREMKTMLDQRDASGKRIYLVKLGNVDARDVTMPKLSLVDDLWMEVALSEEETQRSGVAIIIDMRGYSLRLFKLLTPHNLRTGTKKVELFPIRHIEFHVVNSSVLLSASLALVMPFLSAKTRSNIHIHKQDWSSLHRFLDPECLPVEYGGKITSIDYKGLCNNYIYSNEDLLSELCSLGYEEQ